MSRFMTGRYRRGQGASRGRGRGGGAATGSARQQGPVTGFTLQDEVRNTLHREFNFWGRDSKLRYRPVVFVSAGLSEPLKLLEDEAQAAAEVVVNAAADERRPSQVALSEDGGAAARALVLREAMQDQARNPGAAVTGPRDHETRSPASDTSEEVILFKGRKCRGSRQDIFNLAGMETEIHRIGSQDVVGELVPSREVKRGHGAGRNSWEAHASDKGDDDKSAEAQDARVQTRCRVSIDMSGSGILSWPARSAGRNSDSGDVQVEMDGAKDVEESDRLSPPGLSEEESSDDAGRAAAAHVHNHDIDSVGVDPFDVMDMSAARGNSRKGKNCLGTLQFAVSDEELQEAMKRSWANGRLKKAERKRQREELRSRGHLGLSDEDLSCPMLKYQRGMTLDDVAEELAGFLPGTEDRLSFPPMDAHARKVIHELGLKLQLKSKSTGKGKDRRTVLYRTNRTPSFSQPRFEEAFSRIHRRYFPRLDVTTKAGSLSRGQGRGGGGALLKEGDVVGASAPELGTENRGRTMLEKMGWSMGTALGASNKGILEPVSQVMKRTKAGLGQD